MIKTSENINEESISIILRQNVQFSWAGVLVEEWLYSLDSNKSCNTATQLFQPLTGKNINDLKKKKKQYSLKIIMRLGEL